MTRKETTPPESRYDQIEAKAIAFHREHPEVWDHFCRFTFELIDRGFRHYSAQHGVFARIRWETDSATPSGGSTFKINNNYSAFYARWFMEAYPEHDGFYRTRHQVSQVALPSGLAEITPQEAQRAHLPRKTKSSTGRAAI